MTTLTMIKEVNSAILENITKRIVESVHPEKVIIFGSYACGNPHQYSDLDILVVMESNLPRYKRSVPIYKALAGLIIPKDVLVYTPAEIESWSSVPQAFITSIVKMGRVIYDKRQS